MKLVEFTDLNGVKRGLYFRKGRLFVRYGDEVRVLAHFDDRDELVLVTEPHQKEVMLLWTGGEDHGVRHDS